MRKNNLVYPLIILSLFLAGCGGGNMVSLNPDYSPDDQNNPGEIIHETGPNGEQIIRSTSQRNTSPELNQAALDALVHDNTEFALKLFKLIESNENENVFFSPYSISLCLAMLYNGARHETETQMAQAMEFNLEQEQLHPAFNYLDLELTRRGEMDPSPHSGDFRLTTVNGFWGKQGFDFKSPFLNNLAINYGAEIRTLNFGEDPDHEAEIINTWASENTNGKINHIINTAEINPLTRFILANAVYFYADWAYQFDPDDTAKNNFYLLDGSVKAVDTMSLSDVYLQVLTSPDYMAVKLPFDPPTLSMVILLPDSGKFQQTLSLLDADFIQTLFHSLDNSDSQYSIIFFPKFKLETKYDLKPPLISLGMVDSFSSSSADFYGISNFQLFIKFIKHFAYINVNEAGTEAAAVTVIGGIVTSLPVEPIIVGINRPFIFFIRDDITGAILFIGKIMDPS